MGDLSIMGKIISLIFNKDSLLDNNDNDCIIVDEPICITRYNTYNSTLFDTISKKNNDDNNNKKHNHHRRRRTNQTDLLKSNDKPISITRSTSYDSYSKKNKTKKNEKDLYSSKELSSDQFRQLLHQAVIESSDNNTNLEDFMSFDNEKKELLSETTTT